MPQAILRRPNCLPTTGNLLLRRWFLWQQRPQLHQQQQIPLLLPQPLSRGLASLDEGAVAALGFEHLVFVRAAQTLQTSTPGSRLQRFALWWLQQLSWMVPPQQQPLRAAALARCVVQLVRGLPALPQGTRVIAPEQLWQWTQQAGGLDAALARGLPAEPSLHASP